MYQLFLLCLLVLLTACNKQQTGENAGVESHPELSNAPSPPTHYTTEQANNLIQEGFRYFSSDLNRADSLANAAYYQAISLENDSLIAKTHALLAYVAYFKSNYYLSIEYYKKALSSSFYQSNPERRQAFYNNMGVCYEFQQQYGEANDAYLQSVLLAKQMGDSLGVYETYINLGYLYQLQMQFRESRLYLENALRYFRKVQDGRNEALTLQNLANLDSEEGNEDAAIGHFNLAIDRFTSFGSSEDVLNARLDLHSALVKFKRFSLLKSYQERIRPLIEKEEVQAYLRGTFYMIEGNFLSESENNLSAADSAYEKAYRLFKEQNNLRQLIYLLNNRIILFARMGNLSEHNEMVEELTQILQGNYKNVNASQTEAIERLHQLDIQASEIQQLHQKASNRTIANVLLLLLLLLCLGGLFFLARRLRRLDAETQKMGQKNIELTELVILLKNKNGNGVTHNGEENEEPGKHATMPGPHDEMDEKILTYEKEYLLQLFKKIEKVVLDEKSYLKPDLVIDDLAFLLETNEKEISRAINEIKGQRFTSYINTFRIELAKDQLVKYPDLTIKELAFQCGFSSQPQFQRKFKEMTGMTPEQYRTISNHQNLT